MNSTFPPAIGDTMTFLLTPKILVVDDSETELAMVRAIIQRTKPSWEVETAKSGQQALVQIENGLPDIVVTDLRMPIMDGIELVRKVSNDYPELPVILITARGSEGLAVSALDAGAASYVPKSQMQERLIETIEQVLDRVLANHNYQRLLEGLGRTTYEFTLDNDPALIAPLVDLFQQISFGMELVNAFERRRLGIALDEALLNAMYHGNLELPVEELQAARRQLREGEPAYLIEKARQEEEFRNRQVNVKAVLDKDQARFTITDDGMGFHPGNIPTAHDPKILEKEGGRGLVLMKNFMDEVTFNELGNEVTLVKSKP